MRTARPLIVLACSGGNKWNKKTPMVAREIVLLIHRKALVPFHLCQMYGQNKMKFIDPLTQQKKFNISSADIKFLLLSYGIYELVHLLPIHQQWIDSLALHCLYKYLTFTNLNRHMLF